jgi:transcriptional regulator with XRE-family HTH domain
MRFAEKLRELRHAKSLSQRALASKVGVNFTYLSKIENEKLDFAEFPSAEMISKLARALDADEDELLLLAKKIPEPLKLRVLQRPDAFLAFATCDDKTLDRLVSEIGQPQERHRTPTKHVPRRSPSK